jgi:hypothetical protein
MGQLIEFCGDKRRTRNHFLVTIIHTDGGKFGRVYTDSRRANRFAARKKKSPAVKRVLVQMLS